MITEKDLVEAIAECQGERNPNANTCIKLAAFYTILNNIRGEPREVQEIPSYSFTSEPMTLDSDTDFSETIAGKDLVEVLEIMDELMTAISVYNPRLYAATLEKIAEI